jgi:hypothetical protein
MVSWLLLPIYLTPFIPLSSRRGGIGWEEGLTPLLNAPTTALEEGELI